MNGLNLLDRYYSRSSPSSPQTALVTQAMTKVTKAPKLRHLREHVPDVLVTKMTKVTHFSVSILRRGKRTLTTQLHLCHSGKGCTSSSPSSPRGFDTSLNTFPPSRRAVTKTLNSASPLRHLASPFASPSLVVVRLCGSGSLSEIVKCNRRAEARACNPYTPLEPYFRASPVAPERREFMPGGGGIPDTASVSRRGQELSPRRSDGAGLTLVVGLTPFARPARHPPAGSTIRWWLSHLTASH
jgi:hypothetical protein